MGGEIKKIFKMAFSDKRILVLGLGLVLFFVFVPLHSAQANIFSDIATYILTLPLRIMAAATAIVLFLIALVFGFIFFLLGGMLGSFISQTLSVKVIPGIDPTLGGISVVNVGWEFCRDFVNILFILIIAFIGLATILRLQTYQMQRTLPLLLGMAILVNFSGVFVGFIVDISNLVTNFFIEEFADFSVSSLKELVWDMPFNYFNSTLLGLFKPGGDIATIFGTIVGSIAYGIVLLLFYLLALIIFIVVFLVFLARVIALWILAILSPLAFASYILPATRSWWNRWWEQLIQWAIVGIPLGLFLVLAKFVFVSGGVEFAVLEITDPGLGTEAWGGEGGAGMGLAGFITRAFSPLVGLALMGVGVVIATQMAPAGAQGIINFGKKAGKAALVGGAFAAGTATWRRLNAGERVERLGRRITERGAALSKRKGIFATAAKVAQIPRLTRWAGRGIETGAGELSIQTRARDAREYQEFLRWASNRYSGDIAIRMQRELMKPKLLRNQNILAAGLGGMNENRDMDDFEEMHIAPGGRLENKEKELAEALLVGQARLGPPGYRKPLIAMMPHYIQNPEKWGFDAEFNETNDRFERNGNPNANDDTKYLNRKYEEVFEKMTTDDYEGDKMTPLAYNTDEVGGRVYSRKIMEVRGADMAAVYLRRREKEIRDKIWQYIESLGIDWFIEHAPDMLRWSLGTAAQNIGIGPIQGISRDKILAIEAQLRERAGMAKIPQQRLERERDELADRKRTLEGRIAAAELVDVQRRPLLSEEEKANMEQDLRDVTERLKTYDREITFRTERPAAPAAPELTGEEMEERAQGISDEMETFRQQANRLTRSKRPNLNSLNQTIQSADEILGFIDRFSRETEEITEDVRKDLSTAVDRLSSIKQKLLDKKFRVQEERLPDEEYVRFWEGEIADTRRRLQEVEGLSESAARRRVQKMYAKEMREVERRRRGLTGGE